MSFDLTGSTLVKSGIFVFLLAWAVLGARRRYAGKLSWRDSALMVVAIVLLIGLSGIVASIILIVILQRWVNGEILETIVFVVSLSAMYVVFKYLQRHLEPRLLKNKLSNDD